MLNIPANKPGHQYGARQNQHVCPLPIALGIDRPARDN